MRRPVIFLFLSFIFGIALEYHLSRSPFQLLAMVLVPAAAFFIAQIARFTQFPTEGTRGWARFAEGPQVWAELAAGMRGRVGLACLFLLAALLGSLYFYFAEHHSDPLEAYEGKTFTVEGRIVTVKVQSEDSWQMLITARGAGKRLIQVKGAMEDPAGYIGRWAMVRGEVELPAERRNPGLFDYRLYLKTKGVRVILLTDAGHISLEQRQDLFFSSLARLKYGFMDRLAKEMSPEAYGLMVGMLFGDCSFIGDDVYEAFQKNGIAHILSVSGIHVGIVYLYLSRLLGNRKTRGVYLLSALMLAFYAALSEFSPSVVRAVVMILIHMFSKVTYRRYDFLSCTAASALGMLLVNPFYLFNAGFQLSYMAVFCLSALLPWVNRRIALMEEHGRNALLTEGLRLFSPLLIIQLGMEPITAYLFNYFSVISFFINTPVIAISGIAIPLGICLIPVSFLQGIFPGGGVLFGVGAQAAEILIDVMLRLNDLFYLPGVGYFNVVSPSVFSLLIFYGFFFFLSSEFFRILYQRKKKKAMAAFSCLILVLSLGMSTAADTDHSDANLVFVDVGQGDCLHIRTPGGRNILIDGGGSLNYDVGKKVLLPYLLKNGVNSIDLAIATHLHTDHYQGIVGLAQDMKVKKFGTYEGNALREQEILKETGLEKGDMLYLSAGDRIPIEKGIWIDVLYPEQKAAEEYQALLSDEADENRSCLFLKVYYKGIRVLMTGDIGTEGEAEIMDLYQDDPEILDVDILKVGHHGSRYSTGDAFLQEVSPEIAVFQVGKNNFGHPHPTIIEKCLKKGIIIYRNDLNGAILFEKEGKVWHTDVLLRKSTLIKE